MKTTWKVIVVIILIIAVAIVIKSKKNAGVQVKPADTNNTVIAAAPQANTVASKHAGQANDTNTPAKTAIVKLVDLGANKCIPCKAMKPILEELKTEYAGKMEVIFIDVWENEGAGRLYNINLIPTQIFYDSHGKELFRHEGFFGKDEILAKWKELGFDLSGAKL